MKFEFETTIIESKGAINTAEKVAAIFKNATVKFSKETKHGLPAIFAEIEGKQKWIATMAKEANENQDEFARTFKGWFTTYAQQDGNVDIHFLFPHLTNAAEKLVTEWIDALCNEYDSRIENDK